ncbi:MAG: CHAT domain-containing protein [Niastella sp.]|nr:CHAT domain-containing protein [Niastella sp.]
MLKFVVFVISSLLLTAGLKGQCPDRDSLWRQINRLKDYPYPYDSTRAELLALEKKMIACPYAQDSVRVLLLRSIANTWYYQKNYLNAIRYFQQATSLIRRVPNNPAVDERELLRTYYWIADSYQKINNIPERIKALDSCIYVSRRLNYTTASTLTTLYYRGEYFFNMGDYHHCIDFFGECKTKAIRFLPFAESRRDSTLAIGCAFSSFVWHVNALIRLKRYDEAEVLLNSEVNASATSSFVAYKGIFYGLRAEMELHKGNYDQSIKTFRQALSVEQRPFGRKQLLNTMASEVYFRHYKNYKKALSLFREALAHDNTDSSYFTVDSAESMNIWANMAEVYVQQGMYDTAFRCFRKALDFIRPGISMAEIVNSPTETFVKYKKIHYLTGLLTEQGDTWRKQYARSGNAGDLRTAIDIFKRADQLVNRIKGEQSNLNSKLFWRSNSHGLYEHALEACYDSRNTVDAFYFFEKSRAVLLNDQLAEQRWMGEQDILEQTQATQRLNILTRELDNRQLSASDRATKEAEKANTQQQLSMLTNSIKARNPFYYQSFLDTNFVNLQQVRQSILKDHQGLVEIFSGDSAVYVMIITAKDARFRKIDKLLYDSLANQFIGYLTDYNKQNTDFDTFTQVSHSLYQLIFQGDVIPPGRLIISPDGRYFPFEALVTRMSPVNYLLKDYAISYTYSARYLLNDFAAVTNKKAKPFMGFAPVQYAGTRLPALKESDRSLNALTDYFGSADNFTGREASRNNFLRHFADYRVIQLYTHAMDNMQGEPVIYFADSLLYLSDLVSDKKPATSLVVLSACETGNGKFYQGEGVFSFNRGFAALGIPAAITNLWKAEDKKTYALTTAFYKYLAAGEPADVALQHAKLEFMATSKENALPYCWAVPVLTGKVTVLPEQTTTAWWLLLPAIALALIVVVVVYRWWRGRRAARSFLQQPVVE